MNFAFLLVPIAALALIGFAVSKLLNFPNNRIFDIQKMVSSFSKDSGWMKAFGAFFIVFYLIVNLALWSAFGAEQLIKFVFFLINLVKALVLWLWYNVLYPTVIFLFKLIWHYLIGFLWKNTQLSFSNILPSHNAQHTRSTIPLILKFLGVSSILYILHGLIDQMWFSMIVLVIGIALLIYLLIQLGLIFANHDQVQETSKAIFLHFGKLILATGIAVGLLFTFMTFNHFFSISEIGFPATELLFPVTIVFVFTLILSIPFGITYYLKNEEKSLLSYSKELVYRLPKYLFASPFFIIGMVIVSIIPAAIYSGVDFGISIVTKANIDSHQNRIIEFSNIDNDYAAISDQIELNEIAIHKIDSSKVADSIGSEAYISELVLKTQELKAIEDNLLEKKIFHLVESHYQSEIQTFSFPPILNCEKYSWEIKNSDDKIVMSKTTSAEVDHSSVISFKWTKAGKYSISVIPENSCEKGDQYFSNTTVLDLPTRSNPIDISGPKSLCAYDEATYTASGTFSQYEWIIPEGVSIIEGSGSNKIKVKWGANSGVISLRGNNKDESSSKYSSLKIEVTPGLGKTANKAGTFPEDEEDFVLPSHAFTFYDVADVNDSIDILNSKIETARIRYKQKAAAFDSEVDSLLAQIDEFESEQAALILKWFSTLFGMIGFMLLTLLLIPALQYYFKFHDQLYSYHEEGEHYILKEWNSLREKDARQPLFGWFLLSISAIIVFALAGTLSLNLNTIDFNFQNDEGALHLNEAPEVEFSFEESDAIYKIQIFSGSRNKSEQLIKMLLNRDLNCDIIEKEDGNSAVVVSESFSNIDIACEQLKLFKNAYPDFATAFLVYAQDGKYLAYDSEQCN